MISLTHGTSMLEGKPKMLPSTHDSLGPHESSHPPGRFTGDFPPQPEPGGVWWIGDQECAIHAFVAGAGGAVSVVSEGISSSIPAQPRVSRLSPPISSDHLSSQPPSISILKICPPQLPPTSIPVPILQSAKPLHNLQNCKNGEIITVIGAVISIFPQTHSLAWVTQIHHEHRTLFDLFPGM